MTGTVERAREALRSGLRPVDVYVELAAGTSDLRGAALAVCAALGIPRPDAEQRLSGSEELWDGFGPGEEGLVGELLDLAGLFDVHVTLDERGERICGLMDRAVGALGGISSGVAFSLHRKTATGRLPEAYALLVRTPVRERGDAARYWALLTAAGEELAAWLPPGDDEAAGRLGEARERCAREAAASARAR
ncbi:hypothetical protein [Streptomyces sp. A0592]|uniref:hypothetical protein n=1 Tax=Streptomyces sp. A0592 TaxID=2563099 RepID=UPI00109EDFA2|nr:hypothetical protein [Streptomyces sp. A0592]THA76199.1 hypothetical protein E6U81_35675 [Streptomyces sp. A0592]